MAAGDSRTGLARRRFLAAIAGTAGLAAAPWVSLARELHPVPPPVLSAGVNRLRVVHAVNRRFPALDAMQVDRLLAIAAETVARHFGVGIDFEPVRRLSIEALFAGLPPRVVRRALADAFDFRTSNAPTTRLVEAMAAGLEHSLQISGTTLADEAAFARPYLLGPLPAAPTLDDLARALVETMLGRLGRWREQRAADGGPVIDDTFFNEWVVWDVLGYGRLDADLVLTNQLIASVEYAGLAVHSAVRGGITAGTTAFSRDGRFGTYAFLSTFVFDDPLDMLGDLRGAPRYGPVEMVELAGAYAAHELGHLLLHLGHPFGQLGCVMRPAEGLDFRGWRAGLDPEGCAIGSSPAMRVGVPRVFFDPALL